VDVSCVVALGILSSGSCVLLEQRPDDGPLPGLWQFPGGKVEFGEHPWDALRREIREELGFRIVGSSLFGLYSYVYEIAGRRIHYVLVVYRLRVLRAKVKETRGLRWVSLSDLRRWPVVPGSKPIVADLIRRG
jgi:mutator protein MutT